MAESTIGCYNTQLQNGDPVGIVCNNRRKIMIRGERHDR